ncbi:very short patch repair endonuclease [Bilophila wadsworthia]|uniref:very short patch repair endonuclease n=1 Tax=Bilophila wadsworthia TaxID=35833 RepID=UPI0032C019BB
MDILTPEQRHKNMRCIKSKDTKIELLLRSALWKRGIRYRKNYKILPGKPDIVLTKYKIVIFCDSEFWHGKDWNEKKKKIKTNREYWLNKISSNIQRDIRIENELTKMGWTVLRFWGDDIIKNTNYCINIIEEAIFQYKVNQIDIIEYLESSVL